MVENVVTCFFGTRCILRGNLSQITCMFDILCKIKNWAPAYRRTVHVKQLSSCNARQSLRC